MSGNSSRQKKKIVQSNNGIVGCSSITWESLIHENNEILDVPEGREEVHIQLAENVHQLRNEVFPGKPITKANVAAAVLTLDNGTVFDQQATSRRKGPLPNKPKKKSDGGLFIPSKHLDENGDGRIMDTDAEYKLFDDMAQKLLELPEEERKGSLDLFTEMSMCDSCKDIKKQFEEMFPKINVNVSYKKVFQ